MESMYYNGILKEQCGRLNPHPSHWYIVQNIFHSRTVDRYCEGVSAMDNNRIEYLERELELERMKQAKMDALPDLSEFPEEAVLFFKYQFNPGGTEYSYATLKCNGLWYSTGPKAPKGFSDEEMRFWLANGIVVELWESNEWLQIL